MSITCLKEAQTIQDEFFAHAMEVLKFRYDDCVWKDCNVIMGNFCHDMDGYSPRENLDPSIWKSWLNNCFIFVRGLARGKGDYPLLGFSVEELDTILDEERGSGDLELVGDELVSDPIECQTCYECACGQCSPCSCS